MSAVSNRAGGTAYPLQVERTVFAVTGAVATLVASLVNGLFVGLAGLEGGQTSYPHGVTRSLYVLACLVAVALAIWAAALSRGRPRRASLLGAAAVVLGALATVAIAEVGDGLSRPDARVMLLAIWLFLTSPLDVAVVMGLSPLPAKPDSLWGPVVALAYVGLSTILLAIVVFASQSDMTAWGVLIVWLLLTSAITILGVRRAVTPNRLK